MSKRAVTTRTAGTVTTSKGGVRKSVRQTTKEGPTETPREKLLLKLNLDPAKFSHYDTHDLLDLQYSLNDPILKEKYKPLLERLELRDEPVVKIFPYDPLLKDRSEERKFFIAYQSDPIEAGDCGRCGQKGTVTFVAFNYHRADEAGTSESKCTACGKKY